MEDNLVTRAAAAARLGIKENTLAVWASTKRYPLPYVKIGRRVMYRISDLNSFVLENLHANEAPWSNPQHIMNVAA